MSLRSRFFIFIGMTVLFLGSAGLVWGEQTGRLIIFGDQPEVVNSNLSLTSPVDLVKGINLGDKNLTLIGDKVHLIEFARSGNAIFVIGQREVTRFYRLVPEIVSLPQGSAVYFAFAGSLDGISFNEYSPNQQVTLTGDSFDPISLDFLVPEGSRFLRVKLTVERINSSINPVLGGFNINYDQRIVTDANSLPDETLLVNGSPTNQPPTVIAPAAGTPNSLVVTGVNPWIITPIIFWFIGITLLWTTRKLGLPRSVELKEGHIDRRTGGS